MKGISVVIACYNSAKVIADTLVQLSFQEKTENIPWEVILVDNNSTDKTAEIALNAWKNNEVPLRIILEKKVGEAHARKTGFLAAKYDIISIVDDDNRVGSNWVSTLSAYFENKDIGLVGTKGLGDFENEPPVWFNEHQHAFAIGSLYEGTFTEITKDATVPGAGLAIRKIILDTLYSLNWQPYLSGRVGLTQSAGADSELCYVTRLLGFKIYYSNELTFKHFTTADRISIDRLERMFAGFGSSDVFTLPYKILYEEENGKSSFLNKLRKKWWFNYIGKKLVGFLKFGNTNSLNTDLLKIRNTAFLSTLIENKIKFEQSFMYLENLRNEAKKRLKETNF